MVAHRDPNDRDNDIHAFLLLNDATDPCKLDNSLKFANVVVVVGRGRRGRRGRRRRNDR